MNNELKNIVNACKVHEKREKVENNKNEMFKLEREMANLSFDYKVGTYVHLLDEYNDLLTKKYYGMSDELVKIEFLIHKSAKLLRSMENNSKINDYLKLKRKYLELKSTLDEYALSINVDLRNSFQTYNVPNIFIFQGYIDDNKNLSIANNIILPNVIELFTESSSLIIYPLYNISSKREYRHFYNKVSFKYLESMCNDYSFELDNKKLGKIKIKK